MATMTKGGASDTSASKNFPLRKRTGTASFHLTRQAVDFGLETLECMTPLQAVQFVAETRWGSATGMPCPHCNTHDKHYWSETQLRWKCKCCGKRFSVTSQTVFANHKLPLVKLLKIMYSWSNGAAGKPALQLRRDWEISYPTAFTLVHKLREGLVRGHNTGTLCGVHEMDGMDIHGRRYRAKRNVPQGGKPKAAPTIPEKLKKAKDAKVGAGEPEEPFVDKAEKASQPEDRRLLLVLRQRGVSAGKGAVATRVGVAITESGDAVTELAKRFASAESIMMSDEDSAYANFSKLFAGHRKVSHSKAFALPGRVNNNQAESFNWRMRRADEGIYLAASNKYLKDYAVEAAWREDTRRLSTGKKLRHLLGTALSVGQSLWWRGYLQGHHREEELLLGGNRPAKGRGKAMGAPARMPC